MNVVHVLSKVLAELETNLQENELHARLVTRYTSSACACDNRLICYQCCVGSGRNTFSAKQLSL